MTNELPTEPKPRTHIEWMEREHALLQEVIDWIKKYQKLEDDFIAMGNKYLALQKKVLEEKWANQKL